MKKFELQNLFYDLNYATGAEQQSQLQYIKDIIRDRWTTIKGPDRDTLVDIVIGDIDGGLLNKNIQQKALNILDKHGLI